MCARYDFRTITHGSRLNEGKRHNKGFKVPLRHHRVICITRWTHATLCTHRHMVNNALFARTYSANYSLYTTTTH